MSLNRDGLREPTHIFEAALWGYTLKATCGWCYHVVLFEAGGLWWHFQRRGWDDHLGQATQRLWCRNCATPQRRNRPFRLAFVKEPPQLSLPAPPEGEWKDAVQRVMY